MHMGLTVADVLDFNLLQNARIRTGKEFLHKRQVQWVSAMETPVESFVRQNEVILSTAIGCGQDLELLKQYVQDIIDSGASALMLALGRYLFDTPSEIIELAEKHHFIIVELPWEIRFSDIIEQVMKKLNELQNFDQMKSERVQQALLKFILNETDLRQIANYIQKQIDCPIVITDRTGSVRELSGKASPYIDLWNQYKEEGLVPSRKDASTLCHDPMFQKFNVIELKDQTVLQLPVLQVSDAPQGHLYVLLPQNMLVKDFLTTYRVNILEHSVTTIALWLARNNAIEKTKNKLRSDFIQELAKGEYPTFEQAHSKAKALGYNIKLPYLCIVGRPENLKFLFQKRKKDYDSYEQWFDQMIHYIEEEFFYAAHSLKREIMMTYFEGKLVVFLEISQEEVTENPSDFLDLVERRLRNLLPEVEVSWGVGTYQQGLKGFQESYQNANLAFKIGRGKNGPGHRMMYKDTRVDRLLLNIVQTPEIKEIIMSTIHPLVEYEAQRNMDLIDTFSAYNQCNGNVSQTARVLNLHRQSLLYRLRKIESLTGLSFVNPDDLFLLDLSIKAWKTGLAEVDEQKSII